MNNIVNGIIFSALLCVNSAFACDVVVVESQEREIADIQTSSKVVRASNGSVFITRIDMPWGYSTNNGLIDGMTKDFDVIKNEKEIKSFIDTKNNIKHVFMKNVDGSTLYIVGKDRSITSFISDMENCGKNRFEEVFIK